MPAKLNAAPLCRRQRFPGAFADLFAFMLSESGKHMNHKLIRIGIIHRHKFNAAFHQATNKMNIAGKPVQLGNDKRCMQTFAGRDGLRQLWPVIPAA